MSPSQVDLAVPVPAPQTLRRVHFIAIGGAGMSAVARLLLARGVQVSGSDRADSAALQALSLLGADVHVGHDARHVGAADAVVVSSAIPSDNVELVAAVSHGIPVLHRSQALASALWDRTRVCVAGANGKTTTSAMTTHLLRVVGADPAFAVGGDLIGVGANAALGSGPTAVIEADESDGSFVVYQPAVAVVTNVQPDHLDFYGTFDEVEASYARFARTIQPGGLLVACADDPGAARLVQAHVAAGGRVRTYGTTASADLVIGDIRGEGVHTCATFTLDGQRYAVRVPLPGAHNIANAAGALLAALEVAPSRVHDLVDALGTFAGVRRRFEIVGSAGGVSVVDDYAHNAPKVAALVAAARGLCTGALRVVFQPHLFSRTRDFAGDFARALEPADVVVLMDIYGARELPVPGVTSDLIGDPLRRLPGSRVVVVGPPRSSVVAHLLDGVQAGDLVLTVGAGDVTQLAPMVLAELAGAAREQP